MVDTRLALHKAIRAALGSAPEGDFHEQAENLLRVLGYRSERTLHGQSGAVADFIARFPADNPDTRSEQALTGAASSVRIIFQVTDEEIEEAGGNLRLFRDDTFDAANVRSFLFTAVELRDDSYARGRYAAFTREINKRFPAVPAVVFFRTASGRVTLAFVNVRPNKRNPQRNVIGSVSLVREIDPTQAHRAHVDILEELSLRERLRWIDSHGKSRNFDGLLAAWLDALDTEELNRRFYGELKNWFDRAVEEARFPTAGRKVLKPEEHVIRLITRLLFIWFIKENGLVAEDLFIENRAEALLKDYDPDEGDSYYRAVLQNLFFATLNTEIERRGFSSRANATHRDFSRCRYRSEMSDPETLRGLFDRTPFINGGLFDCLDSEAAAGAGGHRIDYFSDNVIRKGTAEYRRLSIPNRLFFDDEGLITLFNHYKFTVEENTPVEQEVALDPELLGKVFENLLAAYNPETRESARRQTGSYYTPRAVVDYMVDEALVASLLQKADPVDDDRTWWEARLRYLLDYNDAFKDAAELFHDDERERVVRCISGLKVLDPAVGSGAFPMSVLHKLTLVLRRLDANNHMWERLQRELAGGRASDAFDTSDRKERDDKLKDISATFERYRDSDFGRKLYLIQNSIYGVDIQSVATQIAKLRIFISLAIEQRPDSDADNLGIKPLPNLETRFVAADTLLGLGQPTQIPLGGRNEIHDLNERLEHNREQHFHADTRPEKLRLRREDVRLRRLLARELRRAGMPASDAGMVAGWDPYDQNARAEWFDAEYMFGVTVAGAEKAGTSKGVQRDAESGSGKPAGFDVVIGNPPYAQLQKERGRLADLYQGADYATFARTGDIYQLFYEKGFDLLASGGVLSYVTSNSWLKAEYGKSTRRHVSERVAVLRLIEAGKDVFDNVIVDVSILIGRRGKSTAPGRAVDMDRLDDKTFPPDESFWSEFRPRGEGPWSLLSATEQGVMDKMGAEGTPLAQWDVSINRGILTGYNKAFVIDDETRKALLAEDPNSADVIEPVLRGRDIRRYKARRAGQWLIATHNGYGDLPAVDVNDYLAVKAYLDHFYPKLKARQDKGRTPYNLRNCAYYDDFAKEKLFWMDMSPEARFAYSEVEEYCNDKGYMMTGSSLKYLCAVLNSSVVTWRMKFTALTTGMGLMQWKKFAVERLPIPKIPDAEQRPFVRLVDAILQAKAASPDADTDAQEAEIDRLVYDLYGLTDDEIAVVEGG